MAAKKSKNKKKIDEEKLEGLIRQYKERNKPTLLRNKIFLLMHPEIMIIVKGILSKWGRFEDPAEVMSFSWDCFQFCLEKYDFERYKVWPHFRRYSKYFLLLHFGSRKKEAQKRGYLEDVQETFGELAEGHSNIREVVEFRNVLSPEEKEVFDEVVFGKDQPVYVDGKFIKKKDRKRKMSYYRYFSLKEHFKKMIIHLLK